MLAGSLHRGLAMILVSELCINRLGGKRGCSRERGEWMFSTGTGILDGGFRVYGLVDDCCADG